MSPDHGAPFGRIDRRLGSTPQERGSMDNGTCPDIFELSDGRFAIVGTDATAELDGHLPADAGRASYERIVVISRETLLHAKRHIPDL
ncbi:hypothetical protein ACTMTJ_36830 [Phytohabitans sp. LJ34]|uniref:hypothetical protein n=1 Tax=Phytohabitans sp. LJ34 TaxID=3452217 RepID=UPI003F8BB379